MIKKMLLLASMALAAVAFAAPAAQANLPHFNEAIEEYEGTLQFVDPNAPIPGTGFACEVTAEVVSGGGTTAEVLSFQPTTNTCVGAGALAGCVLKEHESNAPWIAHTATDHSIVVTPAEGEEHITIRNVYEKCTFGVPGSHLRFGQVTATPTPTEGPIHELHISGVDTDGRVASGTLTAETGGALEITTP